MSRGLPRFAGSGRGVTPACGHHGCPTDKSETLYTLPTLATVVRTTASLVVGIIGIAHGSLTLLLWGLAIYWLGDVLDGALARLLDRETRAGAVADILSDRLCAATFYLGFVSIRPSMAVPVGIYLANFLVVDAVLSLAFLAWPLTSPNYFYLVDRRIWWWNWSRIGKGINSAAIAVLMVVTRSAWLTGVLAGAILALKLASLVRLERLGTPVVSGCAIQAAAGSPLAAPGS